MPMQYREFSGEDTGSSRGCAWWNRVDASESDRWWSRGWRKIREWSRKAVQPKWPGLLIRRFRRGSGDAFGNRGRFRYDALSYKMNFDQGHDGLFNEERGSGAHPGFGSRYATVTQSFRQGRGLGTMVV